MNISEFRSIANMQNALVFLDSKTEEVRVTRQTLFNRTIAWLKAKISPNPMAGAERDAAHNRFLRAIADHSGYNSSDVSRAESLLSVDLLERKPLTSRRIREVIQDLEARSTPATRENRTTAAWMSRRGIDLRLAERAHDVTITEAEKDVLSAKIYDAIQTAGGDGRSKVDFSQALTITNQAVDEFLDERAAKTEASAREEAAARSATLSRPDVALATDRESDSAASQSFLRQGAVAAGDVDNRSGFGTAGSPAGAPEARGPGLTGEQRRATAKDLLRTLATSKLPGNLKSKLTKLIKSDEITDRAELVKHANRQTADWIMEKRVGRWYGEALKQLGARTKIKHGEQLMASEAMLEQVTESIVGSEEILSYADVKARSRALIAAHVRSEMDGRNV